MAKGINRASSAARPARLSRSLLSQKSIQDEKPCVFISHQRSDIEACEKIAQYIMDAGIDVYLDKYDQTLQEIASEGDPDKLTQRLQDAISNSTHMLCVVSPATVRSYWVPFEVGYGFSHTHLGVLTLNSVSDTDLPDYMRITRVIRGAITLNDFLAELLSRSRLELEQRSVLKSNVLDLQNILSEVIDRFTRRFEKSEFLLGYILLGLDVAKLRRFEEITPTIQITAGGTSIGTNTDVSPTEDLATEAIGFVTSMVLLWEQKGMLSAQDPGEAASTSGRGIWRHIRFEEGQL